MRDELVRLCYQTRHNSADSVPTSNLVCIMEVAIRTTSSRLIIIVRIIYYIGSLVINIQCIRYKRRFERIVCQNHSDKKI